MHKELRWKIPLILFVVVWFSWLAWPLEEKINLGLDLQGGMHLVLEVEAEKAVEFSMEQRTEDIKHALGDEDIEVDRVILNKDTNVIRVILVDAIDTTGAETVLKNYTPWKRRMRCAADWNWSINCGTMNTSIYRKRDSAGVGSDPQPHQRAGPVRTDHSGAGQPAHPGAIAGLSRISSGRWT